MSTQIAIVFTAKTIDNIFQQGGSCSWRVDRNHAKRSVFVVCTRNRNADWSEGPEEHQAAFMIGRVRDVVVAPENRDRFLFQFSEYALLNIPGVWRGDRNPVRYEVLENLDIDIQKLDWQPMPEPDPAGLVLEGVKTHGLAELVQASYDGPDEEGPEASMHNGSDADRPLTMAQAKRGLALTFGISPEAVEITIRG